MIWLWGKSVSHSCSKHKIVGHWLTSISSISPRMVLPLGKSHETVMGFSFDPLKINKYSALVINIISFWLNDAKNSDLSCRPYVGLQPPYFLSSDFFPNGNEKKKFYSSYKQLFCYMQMVQQQEKK